MKAFALAFALALAPVALHAEDTPKGPAKDKGGMCCDSKGGMGMGKGGMAGGLMTTQESKDHMDKMHSMKDRNECMAYMKDHHKMMQERAGAKGMKMPDTKGDDAMCAKMKAKAAT